MLKPLITGAIGALLISAGANGAGRSDRGSNWTWPADHGIRAPRGRGAGHNCHHRGNGAPLGLTIREVA